ncbi:MAG: DUF5702 domain-containing protein [Eubacterium sp.]|nr:DUF5702 domain-containing protein [Eubacterium sp.]
MNNRGQITVYISMVLAVLMIFVPAVINAIDVMGAKTKSVTLLRTASSEIKADYNRYIFDEYHILLIDKDYYGRGEAYIEELIDSSIRANAGDAFDVESVELSGYTGLMENNLFKFKEQVSEYFLYGVINAAVEEAAGFIENENGMEDSRISEMDSKSGGLSGDGGEYAPKEDADAGEEDVEAEKGKMSYEEAKKKDPRKAVSLWARLGIGNLIKPDDMVLTDAVLDLPALPSYGHTGFFNSSKIDTEFNDYTKLSSFLKQEKLTGGRVINDMEMLAYAYEEFSSATDKYDDSKVLHLEKEYLIAGKDTEIENYNFVVNEIVSLKFVLNLIFLLKDSEKMAEIEALATALTFYFPAAEPVVEYLLTACWAYAESVVDMYRLLRGHKVSMIKTRDNWKTSLESLGTFDEAKNEDDDFLGFDYDIYLFTLMSLETKSVEYRMLDVMEVNTVKQGYGGFSMKNAITDFGINADISYGTNRFSIREEAGF